MIEKEIFDGSTILSKRKEHLMLAEIKENKKQETFDGSRNQS